TLCLHDALPIFAHQILVSGIGHEPFHQSFLQAFALPHQSVHGNFFLSPYWHALHREVRPVSLVVQTSTVHVDHQPLVRVLSCCVCVSLPVEFLMIRAHFCYTV